MSDAALAAAPLEAEETGFENIFVTAQDGLKSFMGQCVDAAPPRFWSQNSYIARKVSGLSCSNACQ